MPVDFAYDTMQKPDLTNEHVHRHSRAEDTSRNRFFVQDIDIDCADWRLINSAYDSRFMLYPRANVVAFYSDEVQCAHGATVGALDEKALFYLQSRGLDQVQAQALLIEGFMNDIIEGQPAAIREQAHRVTKTFLESSKS